jgi:hypothetical protein
MFDVYLSERRDLPVVRKGFPIPRRIIRRMAQEEEETGTQRQRGDQARRSLAGLLTCAGLRL